ncbi:hypothetical protein [Aureimonas flava]|uniref:hypothetical protein n=1 Tax=Aureimonas flava TaxID=2320271 RepID=UPI0010A9605A|nr:hypothetical protein [Aureimonas flava]
MLHFMKEAFETADALSVRHPLPSANVTSRAFLSNLKDHVSSEERKGREMLARARQQAVDMRSAAQQLMSTEGSLEWIWRARQRFVVLNQQLEGDIRVIDMQMREFLHRFDAQAREIGRLNSGLGRAIRKLNRRYYAAIGMFRTGQIELLLEGKRLQADLEVRLRSDGWEGESYVFTHRDRRLTDERQSRIRSRIGQPSQEAIAWAKASADRLKLNR